MKYCPKCKTKKPANEFYANKLTKDKLGTYCRSCMRSEQKKKYHSKIELGFYHTYSSYPKSENELKQFRPHWNTIKSRYCKKGEL